MNSRARLYAGMLAAILIACIIVIVLDSRGAFGGGNPVSSDPYAPMSQPAAPSTPSNTTPPAPSGGGYGGL